MLPDTTATGEIPVRDSITTTSVRKFGGLAGPRERVALLIPICLALEENKARYARWVRGFLARWRQATFSPREGLTADVSECTLTYSLKRRAS